jgi:hypothetical protein
MGGGRLVVDLSIQSSWALWVSSVFNECQISHFLHKIFFSGGVQLFGELRGGSQGGEKPLFLPLK